MRVYPFILCTILALSSFGCKSIKLGDVDPVIKEKYSSVQQSTKATRELADDAQKTAPIVAPQMDGIRKEQAKIDAQTSDIALIAKQKTDASSKQIAQLQKENQSLKDKNAQLYNKWLSSIIIAAGLFTAVSVALFFLGHFKSLTLTVISASVLLGAIALQFLLQYILWIGLAVTIITAGCIVYAVWNNKKALRETVKTVEDVKPLIPDQEAFVNKANSIQSKSTKLIVDSVQKKLKQEKKLDARGKKRTLGRLLNKLW